MDGRRLNGSKISEFQKGYSTDGIPVDWERAREALSAAIKAGPVERRKIISEYFAERRLMNLYSLAEREMLAARGQPDPKSDWSQSEIESLAEMCDRGTTQ